MSDEPKTNKRPGKKRSGSRKRETGIGKAFRSTTVVRPKADADVHAAAQRAFPNWVEQRALRDLALAHRQPEVWDELRFFIKDCIDTYNNKCTYRKTTGSCGFPTANTLEVLLYRQGDQSRVAQLEVTFHAKTQSIVSAFVQPPDPNSNKAVQPISTGVRLNIDADDEGRLFLKHENKDISVAQASRVLLETFLFGKT